MVGGLKRPCPRLLSCAWVAVAPVLSKTSAAQRAPVAGTRNNGEAGLKVKIPTVPAPKLSGLKLNAPSKVPGPPLAPSLAQNRRRGRAVTVLVLQLANV